MACERAWSASTKPFVREFAPIASSDLFKWAERSAMPMADKPIKKNVNRRMHRRVLIITSTYSFVAAFFDLPVAGF